MSRYIKFDDAVKIMACEMYAEAQSQGYDVDGIEDFMPEAKAWITDAPSIDIVRCAECKHCHYEQENDVYHCYKLFHRFYDANKHFCSYGERRD